MNRKDRLVNEYGWMITEKARELKDQIDALLDDQQRDALTDCLDVLIDDLAEIMADLRLKSEK